MRLSIFEMEVHPSADIFPMIPKDELDELAQDIKDNGLIHPIVVKDGVLIDGRNRRAACEIAGVDPEITELNGQDPDAYIIASNINRRHMTRAQRAMAVAVIYPDPEKRGRGNIKSLKIKELNDGYLSQSRTILSHLPDEAKQVLSGALSLTKAYELAQQKKKAGESDESRFSSIQNRLPETAELIKEGQISLEAGEAEIKKLDDERVAAINGFNLQLKDIKTLMLSLGNDGNAVTRLAKDFKEYADDISTFENKDDAVSAIKDSIKYLTKLLGEIK